jgi:undecaprenyl-diphosphatase
LPSALAVAVIVFVTATAVAKSLAGKDRSALDTSREAVALGLAQAAAVVPGVSRSGATIMGAMAMGVDRKTAAEFSFFLALPTLTGATVLQLAKHRDAITSNDMGLIALGAAVSFVVAWAVIKAFLAVVTRYGFAPFAWYRIIVGGAALIWLTMR